MKKIFTLIVTLFLGASLALAQTGGDKSSLNPQPLPPGKSKTQTASTTKTKSATKGHKGGKKGKSSAAATKTNSSGGTTPPPK